MKTCDLQAFNLQLCISVSFLLVKERLKRPVIRRGNDELQQRGASTPRFADKLCGTAQRNATDPFIVWILRGGVQTRWDLLTTQPQPKRSLINIINGILVFKNEKKINFAMYFVYKKTCVQKKVSTLTKGHKRKYARMQGDPWCWVGQLLIII